jgi:hypothetical protein
MEFVPEGEDNVTNLHDELVGKNTELLEKLQLLGKAPTQMLFIETALEVLLETVMPEGTKRRARYDVAAQMALHEKLFRAYTESSKPQLFTPDATS